MPALRFFSLAGALFTALSMLSPAYAGEPLTLARAEELAVAHSPWLSHHRTNVAAASERAVYEGRMPDPQLTFGVINVPTDSFSLRDEDMTMQMIGVRQAFPPGNTLGLREQLAQKEVSRQELLLETERRTLLKQIRERWLDLYLQEQSIRVIDASRQLQQRALDAAEARYRAAQEPQQVVLRNRQTLARLDERALMLNAQAASTRAQLSRWLGEAANDPIPTDLPVLPDVSKEFDVTRHPGWRYAQAGVDTAKTEVDMARQEYKPGVMVDVSYGKRQTAPDGTQRSGTLTALVTIDVPLFTGKRQDRRVAEKQSLESAAEFEVDDMRRELNAMFQGARAEHTALIARVRLVEDRLLPDARREASVTTGFARDANELREARMKAIDTELELIQLRVELARRQAELLYYIGEEQQ